MINEDRSDAKRRSFLDALDADAERAGGITVTDWEGKFLESNMSRKKFTEGQRNSIDEMINKYGYKIGGW